MTAIFLVSPGAILAKLQAKLEQSPVTDTRVKPTGVGSAITTLTASLGPALVTTRLYVTFVPAVAVTLPVLLMLMSALELMLVGSLAASLAVLASPPPETFAVLVKLEIPVPPAALWSTVTGTVMVG